MLNEPQYRYRNRKKRKLIKNNQLAISRSESSSYEDDAYIKARRSRRRRSKRYKSLTHLSDATLNNNIKSSENFDISVKNRFLLK